MLSISQVKTLRENLKKNIASRKNQLDDERKSFFCLTPRRKKEKSDALQELLNTINNQELLEDDNLKFDKQSLDIFRQKHPILDAGFFRSRTTNMLDNSQLFSSNLLSQDHNPSFPKVLIKNISDYLPLQDLNSFAQTNKKEMNTAVKENLKFRTKKEFSDKLIPYLKPEVLTPILENTPPNLQPQQIISAFKYSYNPTKSGLFELAVSKSDFKTINLFILADEYTDTKNTSANLAFKFVINNPSSFYSVNNLSEMITFLIKNGAETNFRTRVGPTLTALHTAVDFNYQGMLILAFPHYPSSLEEREKYRKEQIAANKASRLKCSTDLVRCILPYMTLDDINAQNAHGKTAQMLASRANITDIVNLIDDAKKTIYEAKAIKHKNTPLIVRFINYLKSFFVDLTLQNDDHLTLQEATDIINRATSSTL